MSFLGIDTETGIVHPVLPQDTEVPVVLEAGMIDSAQRPTFDTLFLQIFCTCWLLSLLKTIANSRLYVTDFFPYSEGREGKVDIQGLESDVLDHESNHVAGPKKGRELILVKDQYQRKRKHQRKKQRLLRNLKV